MTDTLTPQALAEAGRLTESTTPGRARIRIIEAGQGSSGLYPEQTLQEAASSRVFAAGTLMYLDHPSASESADRPERSVRDLAGRLATDAVYEDGALVADAEVFAHMRPIIEGLAESIGVSIRAMGDINESGEVVAITEARSVDYVTEAGAGGRVLELIESARNRQTNEARNAADWIEVEIHRGVMGLVNSMWGEGGNLTRDEWNAVNTATAEAMSTFRGALDRDAPHLADRDPHIQAGTTNGPTVETSPVTSSGANAPQGPNHEEGHAMSESTAPANGATETNGGAPAPDLTEALTERDNRIEALERSLAERDARDEVRRHVQEHAADLPEAARGRIAGSVDLASDDLATQVTEAVARERAYIAEVAGQGAVRDMGGSDDLSESDEQAIADLEREFQAAGLDEAAAKAAARA